jgi:CRP-like cAMP-binding protein
MEPVKRALVQHPFLAGLDRRYLAQLVELASAKSFQEQQKIFDEGLPANACFLICKGKVAVEAALLGCGDIVIQTLGPGAVLGWSWLLPPYQYHYSARALEATQAIALDGKALRELCERDHDLGYELMKRFALVIVERLAATREHSLTFSDPTPVQVPPDPLHFRGREE